MGGGPNENLLILLPLPTPRPLISKLKSQFPYLTIQYEEVDFRTQSPPNKPTDSSETKSLKTDQDNPANTSGPGPNVSTKSIDQSIYKDTTILFTLSELPSDPKNDAPNLKYIHFFSAGINRAMNHPVYTDTEIPLTSSSGVHGPQISEWISMTLLAHNHRYNLLHDLQKQHKWLPDMSQLRGTRDLVGQRIGILGYGSIGRQTARVANAMGMEVLAYTATPKTTAESRKDKGYIVPRTGDPDGSIPKEWFSGLDKKSLHHFLAQDLDVLVVSVPLTKDTEHFLSTEEFEILNKGTHKNETTPLTTTTAPSPPEQDETSPFSNQTRPTPFLTNISRGPILNQSSLIAALKNKTLRGAALDVTDPEPLPSNNELWDLDNVIVTPHISGLTENYAERSFEILGLNLVRLREGGKLVNEVGRDRGY